MRTLDRYVLRLFLINFAVLLTVLLSLFVLIDLIVDVDKFVEAGQARGGDHTVQWLLATLWSAIGYYGPMLPLLYSLFGGLLVVAASGFTLLALARRGELLAMLTSGQSMLRIAAPLILAGILLNAAVLPQQEYLIPRFSSQLLQGKSKVDESRMDRFEVLFAKDGAGHLLAAEAFLARSQRLHGVLILVRDREGLTVRRIEARSATWTGSGWRLVAGRALTAPHLPEAEAGLSDAPRVPGGGASAAAKHFSTDLSPDVLLARQAQAYPRLLSLTRLWRLSANPALERDQRARMLGLIHGRFAAVLVNVLILLIVLPVLSPRDVKANLVRRATQAAGLTLAAWGMALVLGQLTAPLVGPVTAAWLPVSLYLPLAAWQVGSIRS